MFLDLWCCCMW